MSEKQVNCGECVCCMDHKCTHIDHGYPAESELPGTQSPYLENGPHDCPHFAPSPAARQADAQERIAAALEGREKPAVSGLYMIEPHADGVYPGCAHCDADAHWGLAGETWCSFHFAEEAERQRDRAEKRLREAVVKSHITGVGIGACRPKPEACFVCGSLHQVTDEDCRKTCGDCGADWKPASCD